LFGTGPERERRRGWWREVGQGGKITLFLEIPQSYT